MTTNQSNTTHSLMNKIPWTTVSRSIAATLITLVLTNTLCIFISLIVGWLFPTVKLSIVNWMMLLSFGIWAALTMWAFHSCSLKKVWTFLVTAISITSLGSLPFINLGNVL